MLVISILLSFSSLAFSSENPNEYIYSKELEIKAENGDVKSKYKIAMSYLLGKGVAVDFKKAWEEFSNCKSDLQSLSNNGDVEATKMLADYFAFGRGEDGQCWQRAEGYYFKAAIKDDPEALFKLGEIYERGLGVSKDYQQAFLYYRKSAELGFGEACYSAAALNFKNAEKRDIELVVEILKKNKQAANAFLLEYDNKIQKLSFMDKEKVCRLYEDLKIKMPGWLIEEKLKE